MYILRLICTMDINLLGVLIIVPGCCLGQGLLLGVMEEAVDEGVVGPLVFMS